MSRVRSSCRILLGASSIVRIVRVRAPRDTATCSWDPSGSEGEEVELAGVRIDLGVCDEAPACAGEIDAPDGVESGTELVGECAIAESEDAGAERGEVGGNDVVAEVRGPGVGAMASFSATASVVIHRFRYEMARPASRLTAWTIPSPPAQSAGRELASMRLGPMRM